MAPSKSGEGQVRRFSSSRAVWLAVLLCTGAALLIAVGLLPSRPQAQSGSTAPEFPRGLDWLNVDEPPQLADLTGKIVLLDFLTYGCINCIHVIPDLHALQEKYGDALVILGVHSAKFEHERGTENIRRFAERYGITHPIANDSDFEIWENYGIYAWPSSILIDPTGRIAGHHAGEGVFTAFDRQIGQMMERFEAEGVLDRTPLVFAAAGASVPDSPLRFPGKIVADEESNRLFIADTNHHRIVVTDLAGVVQAVIGSGEAGFSDGDADSARFQRPQGLALASPDTLYVADTGNHSVRRIDLASGTVTTVAGTGEQQYMFGLRETPALDSGLNSPWDLLFHEGRLYIAMAGQHQLWRYHPEEEMLYLHAGSGREALVDGPLLQAALNQPSGLASDGEELFVADSEASAVRRAGFDAGSSLDTIVGLGLFEFGDVDGNGAEVRLQHPKGVAYHEGLLYVADTYNNKIKRLDPATSVTTTLFGNGDAGWRDGTEPLFYEPGGLSVARESLYIADTNNHAIRVADLAGGEVRTLEFSDGRGLLARSRTDEFFGETIELGRQEAADGPGTLHLEISLPRSYKVNDLAPLSIAWNVVGEAVTIGPGSRESLVHQPEYPFGLEVPAHFSEGDARVTAELDIYYCREGAEALCLVDRVRLTVPVTVGSGGGNEIRISRTPPPLPEDR